jgi:hypothetical protein
MTNNGLTVIADEFQVGTILDGVIFQCADKRFVYLNAIHINDLSIHSNKYHSYNQTIIDGWDI